MCVRACVHVGVLMERYVFVSTILQKTGKIRKCNCPLLWCGELYRDQNY